MIASIYLQPLGYSQYTTTTSAIALGSSTASSGLTALPKASTGVTTAIIAVEGAGIRWRDDGTNPTSSVGMPVASGQTLSYTGNFPSFVFIQQTAGAIVNVSYYA